VRKQRVANPKSKPGVAELVVWAEDSWDNISNTLNNAFLGFKNKKNLRQLTKAEVNDLERLKIDVLTNIDMLSIVNEDSIQKVLSSNKKTPQEFINLLNSKGISLDNMNIDKYRRNIVQVKSFSNAI
jgi:hypothetical protein